MPCLTRLYDTAFNDLTAAAITLVAVDQGPPPVNCCATQTNIQLSTIGKGRGYGADLPFASGSLVYQVAVYDPTHAYAGTTIPDLNGNHTGELDVVLCAAPPPSAAPRIIAPATPLQVREFIERHPLWTPEHRVGMLCVVVALMRLAGTLDPIIGRFESGYREFLSNRGIDPTLF